MSDKQLMYCIIAFILGWLVSIYMGDGFCISAQQSDKLTSPYKNQARDTYKCNNNSKLKFNISKQNLGNYISFTSDIGEVGYLTCSDGSKPIEKTIVTQTKKISTDVYHDARNILYGLRDDLNNLE